MGDPGARHHQRIARPRRHARHEPVRSRRALRARQGQALEQGRAPARARRARGRCAFPISAPAAATAFSGSAGASRRCRRGSATPSSAPPTSSTRWTPASRRSAPTRTNCRWSTPRSPIRRRALRDAPYDVLRDWAQHVWRQSAGRAARLLRHDGVPRTRARLGRGLEGRAAGFQIAARRGARTDRLVARARPRSARKADRALRRDGRRFDRERGAGAARPGQCVDRLGHQSDQRFQGLRAGRRRRRTRARSRWSARSSRPTGGRR